MDLEAKIHELLALRVQRRRDELRREAVQLNSDTIGESVTNAASHTAVLDELTTVTFRRGFLLRQLASESLSPLKRWHVEMQLLTIEEDCNEQQPIDQDDSNPQSPVEQSLAAIRRDRGCFDVSFVSSTRIADLKETLFDSSDHRLLVSEALAFSATRDGYTMRVVLFTLEKDDSRVRVRSSVFVPDLQERIDAVVGQGGTDAKSLLGLVWP